MKHTLQRHVLAAIAGLFFLFLAVGPTREAHALFRPASFADQIVKLWFYEQKGAKVHHMLTRLSRQELLEIYELVEAHPLVLEIKENPPDERSVRAYNGLIKTFRDVMNNK
jgi:hypothetical protein